MKRLIVAREPDRGVAKLAAAWHLSQGRPELADRYHAAQNATGQPAPAGERLAVALALADGERVERLLRSDGGELSPVARSEALVRLGKPDAALVAARRGLARPSSAEEELALQRTAMELARQRLPAVTVGGGWERIGDLASLREELKLRLRYDHLSVRAKLGRVDFNTDGSEQLRDRHYGWWDLGLALELDRRPWHAGLSLGLELGSFGPQPRVRCEAGYSPWSEASVDLQGFWNEPSVESAALRIAGRESGIKAVGALTLPLLDGLELGGSASWRHFGDTEGGYLGHGYALELSAAQRFLLGGPTLRVSVDAVVSGNAVADRLPPGIAGIVPEGASVDAVLPQGYGAAGIGLSLLDDSFSSARTLQYLADVWVGWVLPDNELAYRLNLGLGWRPLWRHQFDATAGYASQQGSVTGEQLFTLFLRYAYLFG